MNFGSSNKMTVVGHTLVWHSQTPNWVFAGTNPAPVVTNAADTNAPGTNRFGPGRFGGGFGRYNGPRASRDELLQRMRDHIYTVVGRYQGKVKCWDVVNEALADQLDDLLHHPLPCPTGGLWIAHHKIDASDLKVYDGLNVRLVFGVEESFSGQLVFGAKSLLLLSFVVLNPKDLTAKEHALSLSHNGWVTSLEKTELDVLTSSQRVSTESCPGSGRSKLLLTVASPVFPRA